VGSWSRKLLVALLAAAVVGAVPAYADFPYGTPPDNKLGPGVTPNDLSGDGNDWKFAATPEAGSPFTSEPRELFGVRGAHVVDANASVDTAWQTTTGRPDVTIAVLDSGIKWYDRSAMIDLRKKIRLNKGELPTPETSGPALEPGVNCATYGPGYDANGDGVFNVLDYLCDPRVSTNEPNSVGPTDLLDPEDLIIAFSNGVDEDGNGYVDDIAGWDFLDNDNDPLDDVHYGHGTGEAQDSNAEANNGNGQAGSCPSCTVIPLRVGDSFIADVNNFAQAVLYSVDNNVLVVQEALGTLNMSHLGRDAVQYAYHHGVAVVASAADEAAQHHNWPSNYADTIVVNSVNQYDTFTPVPQSYLQFNGCTNFSTHVTLSIPSSSCSSNATGVGAGLAGLIYSAALNARDHGRLSPAPNCERVDGSACILTANEVRQLMASGSIDGTGQVDDVNFATEPEPSCSPAPSPGCTDPNRLFADVEANRPVVSPLAETRSYPAQKGFDEFYGYGRANEVKAVEAADAGTVLPEAEITSPAWYAQIDPAQPTAEIRGQVYARGHSYSCKVFVAPGSEPNNGLVTDTPPGDFEQVSSNWCDGSSHSASFDGSLANIDIAHLKSRFPADTGSFNGKDATPGPPNFNNRPNNEPFGFVVRVVVTSVQAGKTLTGQDRRNLYLHRDQDMLPGFPKSVPSDGASSPRLADLDGDNRNELIFATSDGVVHAMRRDGTELPGWPVHGDPLPLHTGGHAFTSGEVSASASYGAMLASVAVADLDKDGTPEVIAADMEGKLYVWNADGSLRFKREANIDYSGKPLTPFVNVRQGKRYRTQHGFLASPVVADLDGNGGPPEIIAANMDRHVYAWDRNGDAVNGFPVLVIDRSKISAIDPTTHAPTFNASAGTELDQGAIVDTPAVGDIDGDGKPEIVVGTNEEYKASDDGGFAAGNLNTASLALLAQSGQLKLGNTRLYAIKPTGDPGGPTVSGPSPFLAGWPFKLGIINTQLLPVVGEGVTGSPVIGPATCPSGGSGPKVGAEGNAGPAYIINPNGSSCYGQTSGQSNAMQTDFPAGTEKYDTPAIPAVGHPTFGDLGGASPAFLTPAAGLLRALDLGVNEYQGGQDFVAAYDTSTGQFRPGFPTVVNDLQFITGPSVADIDGLPGEEIVGGTASLDFYAFNAAGAPASAKWPKPSSDWSVADPVIGSFGTHDTDASARKTIVAITRAGTIFAYTTDATPCTSASWPMYHHDLANSGDYRRDATLPARPEDLALNADATSMSWTAPGDDLLCGTADHYEVVESNTPITGANFGSATPVPGAPAPTSPGSTQSMTLPASHDKYVAIRAVDDQGNVGPPASVEVPTYARPKGATPFRVPLVPAFEQCASPNRQHGAPLSFGSCAPPRLTSSQLTVGTPDANGKAANSTGFVVYNVIVGDPNTTANEADVKVDVTLTDVRRQGTLDDYAGELSVQHMVQITDRQNGPGQNEPATVQPFEYKFTVPCTATVSTTEGGRCALSSTFNVLLPGSVVEQKRAIWELGTVQVFDGGPDGQASTTSGNTLFERQGAFVP
jgi:Subtilase family